jgi:competence protein ComEC
VPLAGAIGLGLIWSRSETVGTPAIAAPQVRWIDARILEREEQPSEERVRLILAIRDAETAQAMKVRVNVPLRQDMPGLAEGARIRLRARLMPPAPPLILGAYDFARPSWFSGLGASGTALGPIEILEAPNGEEAWLASTQRRLAAHVRMNVQGSAGTIAAAFASGDRGAIAKADDDAMRDAGLTHLLSISGLHVSALMAACYFMTLKLLALWPWLALRARLPLVAGASGALARCGVHLADRCRGANGSQLSGGIACACRSDARPGSLIPAYDRSGSRHCDAVVARVRDRSQLSN